MKQECEWFLFLSVASFSIHHFEARITPVFRTKRKRLLSWFLMRVIGREGSNKDVSPRSIIWSSWVDEEVKKLFLWRLSTCIHYIRCRHGRDTSWILCTLQSKVLLRTNAGLVVISRRFRDITQKVLPCAILRIYNNCFN